MWSPSLWSNAARVTIAGWRPRSGFEVQYDDLVQIDARYHELPRPCSRPERGALQRETSAAHAEQTVDPNGYVPDRRHLLEVEIGGLVLLGHRERGQGGGIVHEGKDNFPRPPSQRRHLDRTRAIDL